MKISERQFKIIEKVLNSDKNVDIKELAASEGVTLQTIYNDLKTILNIRFIAKKGYIYFESGNERESILSKKVNENRITREKACFFVIEKILKRNLRGIFFIDGGSTGYIFFNCLRSLDPYDLTIITNNPLILGEVSKDQDFFYNNSVFSVGGKLDPVRLSLYSINQQNIIFPVNRTDYTIDYFILGFRAISREGYIYTGNEEEVEQKKLLISKSRNLILIATPDKLNRSGLFKISSIKDEIELNRKNIQVIFCQDAKYSTLDPDTFKELENILGKSRLSILN